MLKFLVIIMIAALFTLIHRSPKFNKIFILLNYVLIYPDTTDIIETVPLPAPMIK